jgi:hypothetical protein
MLLLMLLVVVAEEGLITELALLEVVAVGVLVEVLVGFQTVVVAPEVV